MNILLLIIWIIGVVSIVSLGVILCFRLLLGIYELAADLYLDLKLWLTETPFDPNEVHIRYATLVFDDQGNITHIVHTNYGDFELDNVTYHESGFMNNSEAAQRIKEIINKQEKSQND